MGGRRAGKVKKVGVSLPPGLLEWLDREVEAGVFASRSHAIKVALLWLKKYMDEHGHPPPL